MQLGEIGVVLHLGDDDLAELSAQSDDDLLQQVVRERPRELHTRELHGDRARFRRSNPDRQHALAVVFLENHDRCVRRAVQPEMGDPHLQHVRAVPWHQVPISQEARYLRCGGVSVSIATPIA